MRKRKSGNSTVKGPEERENTGSRCLEKGQYSWRGTASLRCRQRGSEGANFREALTGSCKCRAGTSE